MNTKINLINIIYKKLPYILVLCPCLLLTAFIKDHLSNLIISIPHEDLIDFIMKYIESGRHTVLYTTLGLITLISILSFSTYKLVINMLQEEIHDKILSFLLIISNIFLIIFAILINKKVLTILLGLILVASCFMFLISGTSSKENQ